MKFIKCLETKEFLENDKRRVYIDTRLAEWAADR